MLRLGHYLYFNSSQSQLVQTDMSYNFHSFTNPSRLGAESPKIHDPSKNLQTPPTIPLQKSTLLINGESFFEYMQNTFYQFKVESFIFKRAITPNIRRYFEILNVPSTRRHTILTIPGSRTVSRCWYPRRETMISNCDGTV